ncbi:hypothetical protein LV779_36370 [Streptomyces thinghirensis]|nr:hypothetical protein [Streptomyces thinghirensis]
MADVTNVVADQILPAFEAQGMVISARRRRTPQDHWPSAAMIRAPSPASTACPWTPTSPLAGDVLRNAVPAFFADPGEMARTYPESLHAQR